MPMLIYAATSWPSGMTTDACDMYLVAAAKDGDHQAYAKLCRRDSRQTFQTVLRITGNISDVEDALQELLLKAYVHIGGFEGRSAFSSWLTRIAINSALMLLRKKRSHPDANEFELPESTTTFQNPEESCMQNALQKELVRAIRCLPPRLQVVMQIRYREEAETQGA
jgi:RNA polymerase sigma factor (sigma-70 family)